MDRQRRLRALIGLAAAANSAAILAGGCRPGVRHPAGEGVDAAAALPPLQASPVFVADHGKLVGAFNGFAWVAGSEGVRIDAPNPCDERACFRGADGMLCSRGTIAPPPCAAASPCPREPWALKIGWDVRRDAGPWGPAAKPYVSLDYRGASHARLAAHRRGDPPATEFCADDYVSGETVGAGRFRTECWTGRGDALGSFDDVDKFALELPAASEAAAFDLCVTGIRVGEPVDAGPTPSAPDPNRTSAAATTSR